MPVAELLQVWSERAAPLTEPHGTDVFWYHLDQYSRRPLGPNGQLLGYANRRFADERGVGAGRVAGALRI